MEPRQELFKFTEASRVLRVSRLFLYEAAKSGLVPTVRMGRRLFIRRDTVDKLLREGLPSLFQRSSGHLPGHATCIPRRNSCVQYVPEG